MSLDSAKPIVWAIGGIDTLNLAGLGADTRGVSVGNKVHCATIVTCVTAQNSKAFRTHSESTVAMLEAQWQALNEQTVPQVIKIGMLCNALQVQWVADKLAPMITAQPSLRIVYDPVLRASACDSRLDQSLLESIVTHLLPMVDLLTPNTIEAGALLGLSITSPDDVVAAARQLSENFGVNVLLKGGHVISAEQSIDCYIGLEPTSHPRYISEPTQAFCVGADVISTPHTRGSGCTLASVIAGLVAQQYTFCDAIVVAKSVISTAMARSHACGNDKGGLLDLVLPSDFNQLPTLLSLDEFRQDHQRVESSSFAPCPPDLGLYPVVDNCQWLERLLKLGVRTIQLRAKSLSEAQAEPLVIAAIALGDKYQARVFINDYWQLAIKHQAYGVHLGQEDLCQANLDKIKQAGLRLGLSTHGIYEALRVNALAPSYIALGHIFATQTKQMPSRPQGIDKLTLQVELFRRERALVAIGGISQSRVVDVLRSGIDSVALVTAITKAQDVVETTLSLLDEVGHGAEFVADANNLVRRDCDEVIN